MKKRKSTDHSEVIAETTPPCLFNIRGKPDHELLEILGFEVGKHRGSIHELLKHLQEIDPRIEALIELTQRYLKTPLPEGQLLGCSHDIFQHYQYLRDLKQEHFIVVLLNNKYQVQQEITVSIGTHNRSIVRPKEVFAEAIKQGAAAIVCVHNHPSGNSQMSPQDIDVTQRLRESGQLLDIKLLDHVIVGNNSYTSLADEGFL